MRRREYLKALISVFATLLVCALGFQLGFFDNLFLQRVLRTGALDGAAVSRVRYLAQGEPRSGRADERTEWQNKWFGIDILQYPSDLLTYQEIVFDLEPDLIIETGTYAGGLGLYFSLLLEHVRPSAEIISVDIDPKRWNRTLTAISGTRYARLAERIVFIKGSSTAPEVIEAISKKARGKSSVMVLLDSLHKKDHVLQELELYSKFVTSGGYLIVNDTQLDRTNVVDYGPGPMSAIHDFIAAHPEFRLDSVRDRFIITSVQSGLLKKTE